MQMHPFTLCTDCAVRQKQIVIPFGIPFSVIVETRSESFEVVNGMSLGRA